MPLATHPNATYEVVLSTDCGLPEGGQPVFVFRYLSILDWENIAKLNDEFEASTDSPEMIKLVFAVITRTLCGWRNMVTPSGETIKYDPEQLKAMVTLQEATELMQAAVSQRPTPEDKKKFGSLSPSSTGKSAKTVRGRINAKTSRTKTKR